MAMQGWEYGAVRVEPSGNATVLTGTSPHGQGLATTFAQIVADALGIGLEDVTVLHGDTAVVPAGFGTVGSRGACVGGSAVYVAAQAVREKARRLAAHLLEAAPDDVVFEDGRLLVRGVPDRALGFRDVAREAYRANRLPAGMEPGLEGSCYFDPPRVHGPVRGLRRGRGGGAATPAPCGSGASSAWTTSGPCSRRCCWKASSTAASPRGSPRRCARRWSTTRAASA